MFTTAVPQKYYETDIAKKDHLPSVVWPLESIYYEQETTVYISTWYSQYLNINSDTK